MICVLDVSAAVELVLKRPEKKFVENFIVKADQIISPDLYIPEITNTFWKYHRLKHLKMETCQQAVDFSLELVDRFESGLLLYREALGLAGKIGHPVYDAFYMVLARRNNAVLLTMDNELKKTCRKLSIETG